MLEFLLAPLLHHGFVPEKKNTRVARSSLRPEMHLVLDVGPIGPVASM